MGPLRFDLIIAALAGTSYGKMGKMAKKRAKKFSAVKAVKSLARERVGSPRPGQLLEDPRRKKTQVKHKKNLSQLLSEEE
jgi:hypothetical protein